MPGGSFVVIVPYSHRIEPATDSALRALEKQGYEVLRVPGYAAIDAARSQLATDVLASGVQEIMWIDADIGFDPAAVDVLRRHELPIVSGVYVTRENPRFACSLLPGNEQMVCGQDGGLVRVRYAPAGFLLTRRTVYVSMQNKLSLPICNNRFGRPLIPYFQPMVVDPHDPWYLCEDFAFCERAVQCGFTIWADTTIRLFHFGNYGYSWEDIAGGLPRYETCRYRIQP